MPHDRQGIFFLGIPSKVGEFEETLGRHGHVQRPEKIRMDYPQAILGRVPEVKGPDSRRVEQESGQVRGYDRTAKMLLLVKIGI